jgi:hypothetical protein
MKSCVSATEQFFPILLNVIGMKHWSITRERILKEELSDFSFQNWVLCHHSMARPQVADGGDALQFWRVAANILNKQSRAADKGWSSSLGVGRGANNSSL